MVPIPNDCCYIAPSQLPSIAALLSLQPQIFQVSLSADWTFPTKLLTLVAYLAILQQLLHRERLRSLLSLYLKSFPCYMYFSKKPLKKALSIFNSLIPCKRHPAPTVYWIIMPRHFKKLFCPCSYTLLLQTAQLKSTKVLSVLYIYLA